MINNLKKKECIPIFYACDDGFVKYMIVSIKSLIDNADPNKKYCIFILHDNISKEMQRLTLKLANKHVSIKFVNVKRALKKIRKELPLRDYYSKTTYYRMFIANMFPFLDKVIYIDSDTIVNCDIAQLYSINLANNYVGACHEQVMVQTDVYGNYVEKVLGIDRNNYFNAGVLLINCNAFRKNKVLSKFISLLNVYNFVVTQDEDYLNVLCHNKVLWLDDGWNVEVYGNINVEEDIKIIHYIMVAKPWHYNDCRLKEYFWKYAKKTCIYNQIKAELDGYSDVQKARDFESCQRLAEIAEKESLREDRYFNIKHKKTQKDRLLEKIRLFENKGLFDVDINDDPETKVLMPNKVDYLAEKFSTRIATKFANRVAVWHYEREIKRKNLVIKDIFGLQNYREVQGGAIVTCNHFNPNDNYAIWRALRDVFKPGKRLYKIIREGNFTNFPGLYGFLFRHCNTLPLSSNVETMKKLLKSISVLLSRGEKILVYPEQAMWWNYRKPRPLKNGAFRFAVRNNVPIIPAFITMEDTDKFDKLGFKVQAYTVWFLPAIYPKEELNEKQNIEYLKEKNYSVWKELYENVYKVKLKYGEQ